MSETPRLIPRPLRSRATTSPGRSPVAGRWEVGYADPQLRATAETALSLIAPHCPGLEVAHDDDRLVGPDVRRIRFALAQPGELSALPPALGIDPAGESGASEGYRLTIDGAGIACTADGPRGLMRAAAAVAQLLGTGDELEHGVIEDAPRYAWRGLMVDPARCFIELDDLRRLVDLAALYRLDVLHLHLTDNEAWRIEIPGWPKLAPSDDGASVGWYSLRDYRALQEYAADRHVVIVPEIDLPGHCGAARRAYPELGTTPSLTRPLDPQDAVSARFIDEVYAAIADATQGPYVHIGGDEVFGMPEASFTTAVRRARGAVRAAGKRPIGWQEAARAGSGPEDVAQFWVDTRMADLPVDEAQYAARPEFAAAGLTPDLVRRLHAHFATADGDVARAVGGGGYVLLSPQSHLYLDRPYDPEDIPVGPDEAAHGAERERLRALGFATYRPQSIRDAAAWDPAVHRVPEERIAGVEATVFGSTLRGFADLSTMLLPRLPGIAEIAWCGAAEPWPGYGSRLGAHAALWRQRALPFFAAKDPVWS